MQIDISSHKARWSRFAKSRAGRRTLKALRWTVTAAIVGFLGYKLLGIGWTELWNSLPRTPWFYLIFVAIYFTLPTFESLVYGRLWKLPARTTLPAMIKKRVLNVDVVGYSGEVYLYMWARRHVDRSDRELAHMVKDYNIVSSIASTLVAVGLLIVFVVIGQVPLPEAWLAHDLTYVVAAVAAIALVTGLTVHFRRAILMLPGRTLLALFGLHVGRLLFVMGLQVAQWAVVLPEVPLSTWCTFLAVQIVVSRVPFLPSRDLVFAGAGMELARAVKVSSSAVAGMLLVHTILSKIANFTLFTLLSVRDRRLRAAEAGAEPAEVLSPDEVLEAEREGEPVA